MPNPKGNVQTLTKYRPKWKSGETRTIRVPVILADQILGYAHQLDEGAIAPNQSSQVDLNHLSQVIAWLEDVEQTPRNNFSREKKGLVRKAIEQLKSLSQVNH